MSIAKHIATYGDANELMVILEFEPCNTFSRILLRPLHRELARDRVSIRRAEKHPKLHKVDAQASVQALDNTFVGFLDLRVHEGRLSQQAGDPRRSGAAFPEVDLPFVYLDRITLDVGQESLPYLVSGNSQDA